jgi:GxxExxY protein
MDTDKVFVNDLVERVIGRAFVVSNTLGTGFLEKIYENALAHELRKAGLMIQQQRAVEVRYDGMVVGTYVADLLVENALLIELKAIKALDVIHSTQCLNYLRATGLWICLLLNFGNPRLQMKRIASGP